MSKKFLAIAAVAFAAVLSAITFAPAVFTQTASTAETVQPATLPVVGHGNFEAEIAKSDRPVFVLIVGEKCGTCSGAISALAAQAGKHPEWKFVQVIDTGASPDDPPAATIVLPGLGQTYISANFVLPADMDAFIAQRMDAANKLMAAKAKVDELKKQVASRSQPFADELKVVYAEAEIANQPFKERLLAIKADKDTALASLRNQVNEIRDRRVAAVKPFEDQIDAVNERLSKETAGLNTEWQGLQSRLKGMRARGIDSADPAYKSAFERSKAIEAEYAEKAKPFDEEIVALEAKIEETRASFIGEMKAVNAKIAEAGKPFDEKSEKVRQEAAVVLKPFRDKTQEIETRKAAALGTLPDDLSQAEDAFFDLRLRKAQ